MLLSFHENKRIMRSVFLFSCFCFFANLSFGQYFIDDEADKCGHDEALMKQMLETCGDHWGYGYDSLLVDIARWESNEYVSVSSLGQSVQGREMFELTITDQQIANTDKEVIYIHTRTHPGEVQSFWVTNELINELTGDTDIGGFLRSRCIFYIVPMYNPDGVELEYARENANHIDIESNWSNESPQIEVMNLRNRFEDLMSQENPIHVALNMHSAYACKRYFVFHHPNGTTMAFAQLQELFITSVRSHFFDGIEPFSYYVSWQNGTPTHYPESWWWINFQSQVMALTYEDMNCATAGFYEKTAYAMLYGISDYFGMGFSYIDEPAITSGLVARVYPNPFHEEVVVEWNNFEAAQRITITDLYGRKILALDDANTPGGFWRWDGCNTYGNAVPAGTYILRLEVDSQIAAIKIIRR